MEGNVEFTEATVLRRTVEVSLQISAQILFHRNLKSLSKIVETPHGAAS